MTLAAVGVFAVLSVLALGLWRAHRRVPRVPQVRSMDEAMNHAPELFAYHRQQQALYDQYRAEHAARERARAEQKETTP